MNIIHNRLKKVDCVDAFIQSQQRDIYSWIMQIGQ